jgi:hypothetical protein
MSLDESPGQRNTRKRHERMAWLLEDALALYIFGHPEQEDDLGLVLSDHPYRKDHESLEIYFKAYNSFYEFLKWCLMNKYITKSEYKLLLKAYNNVINTLCEKMQRGKQLRHALGSSTRSTRKRERFGKTAEIWYK